MVVGVGVPGCTGWAAEGAAGLLWMPGEASVAAAAGTCDTGSLELLAVIADAAPAGSPAAARSDPREADERVRSPRPSNHESIMSSTASPLRAAGKQMRMAVMLSVEPRARQWSTTALHTPDSDADPSSCGCQDNKQGARCWCPIVRSPWCGIFLKKKLFT